MCQFGPEHVVGLGTRTSPVAGRIRTVKRHGGAQLPVGAGLPGTQEWEADPRVGVQVESEPVGVVVACESSHFLVTPFFVRNCRLLASPLRFG